MRFFTLCRKHWVAGVAAFAIAGLLGGFFASGVIPTRAVPRAVMPGPKVSYVYSVKFACVNEVGPSEIINVEAPFARALYRTVVNIHNPYAEPVKLTKKAALARSEDLERGPVSDKVVEELGPDQALAIDCLDIKELFGGFQPIGDGFVVIESELDLDVVAVYTAQLVEEREKDEETVRSRTDENLELWNKIWFIVRVPLVVPDRPLPPPDIIGRGLDGIFQEEVDSFFDVFFDIAPGDVSAVLVDGTPLPFPLNTQLVVKVPNFSGAPPPSGPGGKPGLGPKDPAAEAKEVLVQQLADDLQLRQPGLPRDVAEAIARAVLDLLEIEILDVDFGVGKGVGTGVGVGRGIGVGVGAGVSIDVEYIDPKVIRQRSLGLRVD